jgi:hypothetical protein
VKLIVQYNSNTKTRRADVGDREEMIDDRVLISTGGGAF